MTSFSVARNGIPSLTDIKLYVTITTLSSRDNALEGSCFESDFTAAKSVSRLFYWPEFPKCI